jgi:hypothetical protein
MSVAFHADHPAFEARRRQRRRVGSSGECLPTGGARHFTRRLETGTIGLV